MRKIDMAYMAGVFDGEGCIIIHTGFDKYKTKSGEAKTYKHAYITVSLANTNEWIVRQFQFAFGGNVYLRKKATDVSRKIWAWQVNSKKSLNFLEAMAPYLRIKKPQAEIAIGFEKRIYRRGSVKVSASESAVREAEKILISNYNRGRKATKDEGRKSNEPVQPIP